jgi:uncharacterized protein (DUF433 family)
MREPNERDEMVRVMAIQNGCEPYWHNGIFGWAYHCGCDDGLHNCDQQCSMIDETSAGRKRKKAAVAPEPQAFTLIIEVDPQKCGGRPVIVGTRFPVQQLCTELAAGEMTVEEIFEDFDLPKTAYMKFKERT